MSLKKVAFFLLHRSFTPTDNNKLAYEISSVCEFVQYHLIKLWPCPEHIWVGGGITLPVVVDEAYRD